MRPIRILRATLAALVLGAAAAHATTYMDTGFGTPTGGSTPRSLAMGSTGISLRQGSDALYLNPAVLAPAAEHATFDLSLGFTQANEDRLVPLFDSFNSYVTETAVALNRNTYGLASGGAVYRIPGSRPMALGVGVFPRYDFDYDYYEEFRDPNPSSQQPRDRILQKRTIEVEGRMWSISAGYGAEILPHVQIGLSAHRYAGDASRDRQVVDYQVGTSTSRHVAQELGGWGWSAGAWGSVGERVDLGASFEGPFSVDGTFESTSQPTSGSARDTSYARTVKYPGTLRCGLTYHPRNTLRTTFTVEGERRFWRELSAPTQDAFGDTLDLRNTWDLRLGLEHVFYNDLPVRFGFRYLENYADTESERMVYSVGVGYRAAGFDLDVTGLFSRQTSRQDFLFDPSYLTYQAPGSTEKVEDNVFQLVVGLSRGF